VGFRFCRTQLFDLLPVPFHTGFEEVNLRFYVRRRQGSEERRSVVFIAGIVPKHAVARLARRVYGENYVRLTMDRSNADGGTMKAVEYRWRLNGACCKLHAQSASVPAHAEDGVLLILPGAVSLVLLIACGVPFLLILVALIAVWLPAARASRVSPVESRRYE